MEVSSEKSVHSLISNPILWGYKLIDQLETLYHSHPFLTGISDTSFFPKHYLFRTVLLISPSLANFLTPPVSSPRVGSRSVVLIPVPVQATSGFITFAPQSLQVRLIPGVWIITLGGIQGVVGVFARVSPPHLPT